MDPETSKRVYLVRHAESERLGSPFVLDPALTTRGEAQLDALMRHVGSLAVDAIVCSELIRARRTAEAIAAPHGLVPVIDPAWNEFHTVGAWQEHGREQVDELIQARFYRPDDRRAIGESLRALYRRAMLAWNRVLALPARNVLVVSHNAVLGTLVQALLGLREDDERSSMIAYPHAAITELQLVDRDDERGQSRRIAIALRIADASYLPPDLVTR